MKPMIPLRPATDNGKLSDKEKDCIAWYVLSGCTKVEAFARFIHPEYFGSKSTSMLETSCNSFFAQKEVRQYIQEYRDKIEQLTKPKIVKVATETETEESFEARKASAKRKAMDYAMKMADELNNADVDAELVLKVLDKVGILEDDEVAEEQPRRYLPVRCADCEYRKFVEENCKEVKDE